MTFLVVNRPQISEKG